MPSEENWRETVDSILSLSPLLRYALLALCGRAATLFEPSASSGFHTVHATTRVGPFSPANGAGAWGGGSATCWQFAHTYTHTHTLARSVCICICIRICFSCCLAWINYPGAHCSACEYTNVFQYCRIGLKAKAKMCRLCGIVQHIPVTFTMYNILVLSLNARQHCM